jgi:ribosomal protein S6
MGTYECILIFNPSLDDAALTAELHSAEEIIKGAKGAITVKAVPVKKELGYRVKKHREGWVVLLDCEMPKVSVAHVYETLKLKETLIKLSILSKEVRNAIV